MRDALIRIWNSYWGLVILVAWAGAFLALGFARQDPYDLDEAAAHALLVNWTVVGNVVSPVVTLGAPDFRALIFAPLGIYWPGSLVAVKVFTLFVSFAAVSMLYRWSRATHDSEAALLASGLMLIAPLTLTQANAIGIAPYLILALALGAWVDQKYRHVQRHLGGWYFLQLLLIILTVSLHPVGLAYPAALTWMWLERPIDTRHQRHVLLGISAAVLFAILFRLGWPAAHWFANPLAALAQSLIGQVPGDTQAHVWLGTLVGFVAAVVLLLDRRRLAASLLGRILMTGALIGVFAADQAWAMLILVLLLYSGLPLLIEFNQRLGGGRGFAGQRGLVMAALVMLATVFMLTDKAVRQALLSGTLMPSDELIQSLTLEIGEDARELRIASQWPARTMLATRHAAFPLPPAGDDLSAFSTAITEARLDYLVFDPSSSRNFLLSQRAANAAQLLETVSILPAGVILRVRHEPPAQD